MRVESVNVGRIRTLAVKRGAVTTAIWKTPVAGPVRAEGVNLRGDDQADRSVHGGPDKAIYAYAAEDTEHWERELGRALGPGAMGENLTVRGIDVNGALVGERWSVGSALLEVRQPRVPCFKLGLRMGDPGFVRDFAEAGRPGAYLAIIEEGEITAGDLIEVVERPDHPVSVRMVSEIFLGDRSRRRELLAAPGLPPDWRRWATRG